MEHSLDIMAHHEEKRDIMAHHEENCDKGNNSKRFLWPTNPYFIKGYTLIMEDGTHPGAIRRSPPLQLEGIMKTECIQFTLNSCKIFSIFMSCE